MNTNNFPEGLQTIDDLKMIMNSIYRGRSTEEVKQATQFLKGYCKNVKAIPQFFELLTGAPEVEIRQLSSVLIKRNIAQHFIDMEKNDRETLRSTILTRYFDESSNLVRKSIASLIAHIAKAGYEHDDPWNQLLAVIADKTSNKNAEKTRTDGFLLLSVVLEVAGVHLENFFEELFKFFFESIRDNSPAIRKQTLLCVLNMFLNVSEEKLVNAFHEIYPLLLEAFFQSLQEQDEDIIQEVVSMLFSMTEVKSILFNVDNLAKLLEVLCSDQALQSKYLPSHIRESMLDIIYNIVLNYKSTLVKNQALQRKVIEITFVLICTKEKDEDPDREPLRKVAAQFLRNMATILPKKKSYPIYKELVENMFKSDNNDIVEGAFVVLANLAEGCAEYLKRELADPIMNVYIKSGIQHPNLVIRRSAFYAINMFAQFLLPDILDYHSLIVPELIKNLDENDNEMINFAVLSLEIFCEEMDKNIIQYLQVMLPKLLQVLDRQESTLSIRRHSILAMSSCAEAAQEKFVPYAIELIPYLVRLLEISNGELIDLRSTSTACLGTIVGHCLKQNPEVYTQLIAPHVPTIFEGLNTIDNTILKEFSFQFFYNLAHFLGRDFKPYLDQIVKLAAHVIENVKAASVQRRDGPATFETDSEDEDIEGFHIDNNIIEELSAAVHCLGETALACAEDYAPYYEDTVKLLEQFTDHYHANIRLQTLICYKNIAKALVKADCKGEIPKFQRGLPVTQRFSSQVEQFIVIDFMEKVLHCISNDGHIDVVRGAFEIIDEIANDLGPAALDHMLERITECILEALTNNTLAQKGDFEEDDEIHSELFGAVTELIESLCKVCGDGYIPYFNELYKVLVGFCKEDKTEDDISQTIGTFAQALKYMPSLANQKALEMLKLCFDVLEYGDEYINRNAAFCISLICELGKDLIKDYTKPILEKLRVIYENSAFPDTKDNAIAAIGRMIYSIPGSMPLELVLPPMIGTLPLKGDIKENRTVLKAIIFLFETNVNALNGLEEKCVEFIMDCFKNRKDYKIKDENVLRAMGAILKQVSQNEQGKKMIEGFAANYSQEDIELLGKLISA